MMHDQNIGPVLAINVPDISPKDDQFTALATRTAINWCRLSGLPANALERSIPVVRVSRYRAALQAAARAGQADLVISHLPLMTAAVEGALRLRRRRIPHLAFAFNFTRLPTGSRLHYLRAAFRTVDQFAIFSRYEADLYATRFDLPVDRFSPLLWTQDVPPVDGSFRLFPDDRPYLCAIGGEGRDFHLLCEAARRRPAVPMVIIARPHSMTGLSVPDNVRVLTNIPLEQVWGLGARSAGVLLPLLGTDTCCGHITLVSAKLLGLPIITTHSLSTAEYVEGRDYILQCEPGDVDGFVDRVDMLIDQGADLKRAASDAAPTEREIHSRAGWAAYIDRFITDRVIRR